MEKIETRSHTPGPWKLIPNGGDALEPNPYYWAIVAGAGFFDDQFEYHGFRVTGFMTAENAKVLTSAPELLKALKDMLRSFDDEDDMQALSYRHCDEANQEMYAAVASARAAIAKAEGNLEP
jgi:hypothetical protein